MDADRKEEIENRPDVRKWITRMKKAIKAMPEDISLLATESGLLVVVVEPGGGPYFNDFGGYDPEAVIDSLDPHCGAGAW